MRHHLMMILLILFVGGTAYGQTTPASLNNCVINNVAHVGSGAPFTTCWGGGDVGSQINAAIASIQGYADRTGKVVIQTGTYALTTPIAKPYWVMLDGQFAVLRSRISQGCSIIDGSPIPANANFAWTWTAGGIKDITITPDVPSSPSAAPYGICSGGDPSGVLTPRANKGILETYINVHVQGFKTANWVLGNSSSQSTWLGGTIDGGGTTGTPDGMLCINNTGLENENFHGTQFLANKGFGLNCSNSAFADFHIFGASFDYNHGGAINFGNGDLKVVGTHFEQSNQYIINGVASGTQSRISIDSSMIALTDIVSKEEAFIYVGGTNSHLSLGAGNTFFVGAGHTVNEAVNWQSAGNLTVFDCAPYVSIEGDHGKFYQLPAVQPRANIKFNVFPEFSSGLQVDQFIQAIKANLMTMNDNVAPSGFSGKEVIYEDSTLHQEKRNYNNTGFFPVPLTGNTNGTHSDSGFFQTGSAAGCTTAASVGGVCASPVTIVWPVAFADTNYRTECSPTGTATNLPGAPNITAQTASTVTVNYFAVSGAAASWQNINCVAVHN
jgi:hypothetical protein